MPPKYKRFMIWVIRMYRFPKNQKGFTLIELIIVVVIIGVLTAVAARKIGPLNQSARIEETKAEMNTLAMAICGNPELENNGIRIDFGYIGDIGAMPPNLDALYTNPGSYSTWNGPYIKNSFEQIAGDYKKDAWQADYAYTGGVTITSTGSGSNIIRNLAGSGDLLLHNTIGGNVLDLDGTPPGTDYDDSVMIRLTIPDGNGGLVTKSSYVDAGGYFNFDSIPIGNHDIEIIYVPENDTLNRFVSVLPGVSSNNQYLLPTNVWFDPLTNLDNGLVAYWQLDDGDGSDALDISGNNYHGILVDMDTTADWVSGKIGEALDFDGTNDYVDLGDSLDITEQISVAAWIKPSSIGNNRQIVSDGNNGAITAWELKTSSGSGQVSFRHWGSAATEVQSTQSLLVDTWTHVVGVYTDNNWKIYWNGSLDNSNNGTGPIAAGKKQYIGAIDINGTPGQFWEGVIDDVRIYNRPLNADEVQALYNLGN